MLHHTGSKEALLVAGPGPHNIESSPSGFQGPAYLSSSLKPRTIPRAGLKSSSDTLCLSVPPVQKRFGKRTLCGVGPKLLNALPLQIQ